MYVSKIGIDGMMCGQCESHVSALLRKIDGALTVKASHFKNQATICSPRRVQKEEAVKALEGSGYRLLSFDCKEQEKEPLSYRLKNKKYRKTNV